MNLQLEGKRALISGSTAGIGYAIAEVLAKEGASVVVNGRTESRVNHAIASIAKVAPRAKVEGIAADLGTSDGAAKMTRRFPDVDVLVNNLGIFPFKPFQELTDADWLHIFEVNVLSGVRLSRHYLPGMKQRNWGRIIFISSESAVQIPGDGIHYGMTKTAQIAVARGLAETTGGMNVTVNSVLAGPTSSEGVEQVLKGMAAAQKSDRDAVEKEFFRTIRPTSLLKRFTSPDEVAAMVAFVASPLSSATNGAALRADGGVVKSIL